MAGSRRPWPRKRFAGSRQSDAVKTDRTDRGAAPVTAELETSPASLLVVGLPCGLRPGKLRRPLREALNPYGLRRLRVAVTHTGHCRGFAVADFIGPEATTMAEAAKLEIMVPAGDAKGAESRSVPVQLSRCCGGKVDSLFPFVPESLRRQVLLDSEAMHSTLDQALGDHMIGALVALCIAADVDPAALSAVDGCSCCGGSALVLHRAFGGRITAVEFNEARADLLRSNLALLCPDGRAQAICGDFCKLWRGITPAGVVFLDVPWGGPQYGEAASIRELSLGGVPLQQLLAQLVEAQAAPLLAVRLPRNFDTDSLAIELSSLWESWSFRWDNDLQQPERPMPFRIDLGSCGILFVVCVCGREACGADSRSFLDDGFRLADLDSLVHGLRRWDGEDGHRHRVAFFDWEACRWIPLTRWKGCKPGLRSISASTEMLEQECAPSLVATHSANIRQDG